MSRKVTQAMKKYVAGRQQFTCNNKPGSNLLGLENYYCPLWNSNNSKPGNFDESGYDIDHIIEWSVTANDSLDNLQALCPTCHKVKTKRFMMNKKQSRRTGSKQIIKKTKKLPPTSKKIDPPISIKSPLDNLFTDFGLYDLPELVLLHHIILGYETNDTNEASIIKKLSDKIINSSRNFDKYPEIKINKYCINSLRKLFKKISGNNIDLILKYLTMNMYHMKKLSICASINCEIDFILAACLDNAKSEIEMQDIMKITMMHIKGQIGYDNKNGEKSKDILKKILHFSKE